MCIRDSALSLRKMERAWTAVAESSEKSGPPLAPFENRARGFAAYAIGNAQYQKYLRLAPSTDVLDEALQCMIEAQRFIDDFAVAIGTEALIYEKMFDRMRASLDSESVPNHYERLLKLIALAIDKTTRAIGETVEPRILTVSYNNLGNEQLKLGKIVLLTQGDSRATKHFSDAKEAIESAERYDPNNSVAWFTHAEIEAMLLVCRNIEQPTTKDFKVVSGLLAKSHASLKKHDQETKKILDSRDDLLSCFPELTKKYPKWYEALPEHFGEKK